MSTQKRPAKPQNATSGKTGFEKISMFLARLVEKVVAYVKNFKWTPKRRKVARLMAWILLGVMLILVALSSFNIASLSSIRDGIRGGLLAAAPGKGYPYQVNSSSVKKVDVLNGNLFLLKDGETVTLNSSAKEVDNKSHTYANPAMSISGRKALVYNRGGHRYRVETRADIIYEDTTAEDEDIIVGAIGEKGNVALATLSDKAASRLTVWNSTHKTKEFIWNCSDYTITAVALSDNGKYVAVSVIGAEAGEVFSKVFVFDFKYSDPVCEFEYPGTAIVSVHFSSNNDVVAIGDNKIAFLKNLKKNVETDLETNTVSGFCYGQDGETVVVLAEYGSMNSQVLRCYNASGKVSFEKKYTEQIKSVTASDTRIQVLCNGHVDSYGMGGIKHKSYVTGANTITSIRVGNTTYAYEMGRISKCHTKYKVETES